MGLRPAPQTLVAILAESLAVLLLGVALLEARAASRTQSVMPAMASPTTSAAREAA